MAAKVTEITVPTMPHNPQYKYMLLFNMAAMKISIRVNLIGMCAKFEHYLNHDKNIKVNCTHCPAYKGK
jgi:hypothetical protein